MHTAGKANIRGRIDGCKEALSDLVSQGHSSRIVTSGVYFCIGLCCDLRFSHLLSMLFKTLSASVYGIDAYLVEVEVDVGSARMTETERKALEAVRKETPADAEFSMYSNRARTFLDLAANILDARMATAHGDCAHAVEYWKNAVQIQDRLYYGEPPEWFYPVRESLGAALMLNGQPAQAESVFRADLEQYPGNPRSLFGLLKSLEAQNKISDADWVRREFEAAWKNADVTLELRDL
jgi:hypothetical protein